MSAREIKIHPLNVRPGDVVVSVKSTTEITVRREVADLPTEPCSIGYATAYDVPNIFVVRTEDSRAEIPWFLPAPIAMEGHDVRWLRDDEISAYRPLAARTEVTREQVLSVLMQDLPPGGSPWGLTVDALMALIEDGAS